jgi:flagellar hook-associated protein 2
MATITTSGLGSGLDIQGLVAQLVAAERAPKDKRLTQTDARLTAEFTALATLKGALSTLRSAAMALQGPEAFGIRKAAAADESYFTASAGSAAIPGDYTVQVAQLATAARLGSGAYADGPDTVVGTGTLSITVGDATFDIEIAEGGQSLAAIRDAINSAPGNTAVRATLIRDASGTYLVLTGTASGAGNAVSVSAANASAGLQQLVDDLNDFDPERDVAAQDAIAYVSGYEIRGSTNTIADAIDGVTLVLKKVTPEGEAISLSVQRDDAAIQKKAEGFVTAWNALAQQIAALGRYDATTKTAGPLLGDSMLRGIDTQLRRMLGEPVPGTTGEYRTLTSLGIEMTETGTLKLDAAKFQKALAADPDAVSRVFSSGSGVAVRISEYLGERLSATGEIAARNERISSQQRRLEQEREALDARMQVIQERYLKQFTAMDALLAQLQTTSSYLTQQLQNLSKLSGGKSG